MGDGLNDRSGRFWTWLAGRLRAELSIRSKRGAVLAESQPEWRASLGW
jgi:hypothetical protein